MANLQLGPMLRHVTATTATIWVETDIACEVRVLGRSASTFCVEGHHYALVVLRDLPPASVCEYTVELDEVTVWPPPRSAMPPSVIRTLGGDPREVRILFGSCRAAAPHEPPWSLEADVDKRGRGVDALRTFALDMVQRPIGEWPDMAVFLGDQVYADDPSPGVRARRRFERNKETTESLVADFEEYTWLYHESWEGEVERWFFSVMPSAMIFDDHDMIDDWNISRAWVDDIRAEAWWQEHIIGGLVSYYVYQHVGNLSPAQLDTEGMVAGISKLDDAGPTLREWARRSEEFTPVPGGYRFSHARDLGPVKVVTVDSRNGRTLDRGQRAMVDEDEWAWFAAECRSAKGHLIMATSLPVFVPGGLHGIQQWNEALCDGAWGRTAAWLSEKLRRALDLEDWCAFDHSFRAFVDLLAELAAAPDGPTSITVVAGDIHFSYVARVDLDGQPAAKPVHQVVCSPIRNVLGRKERRVLRFGVSRVGKAIGQRLLRSVGRTPGRASWAIEQGPIFRNTVGLLTFDDREARLRIDAAVTADGRPALVNQVDRVL